MRCASFEPTLQPRQGSQGFVDDASAVETYTSPISNPQAAPEEGPQTRPAPHIQFIKPEATDGKTEATPTARLSASPSSCYPTYQAGVVQPVGKSLPPPPMAASPMAGMSPLPNGASFQSFATRGAASPTVTPSRGPSAAFLEPCSPTRTPGASPTVAASPGRRRGNGGERRGNGQPTSRIDPEQVPRPVNQQPDAVKEDGGKVYETSKYHIPPAATAVCTIVDRGSCSCEFVRSTVNQVPAYPSTANTAHVPIAVVCQPFAELTPKEEPVPLIDYGESGPFRCTRCKAYANPHFTWFNNGREAACNFCGHRIQVPDEHLCPLDGRGRRRDHGERPELQRGTVDYIAPRDYSDTLPGTPAVVFVLEASRRSIESGIFPQVLWSLRSLLGFLEAPASRIGIITFDQRLQFYAFYPGLEGARTITVADIEDPFVPCGPDALCVDAEDESFRAQIDALLEELPETFAGTTADQVAGGAALKAAVDLVGMCGGGHVIMFHSTLPNTGLGAMRPRDDLKHSAKPEEAGLYTVQQAPFFDAVAADCLARGVAVSVFCTPPVGSYIDMASLSTLPRRTGGEVCHIPGFDLIRDGERLHYDLSRAVVQDAVYSCVFKLRCSKGLAVESMLANWDPEVIDPSTFHTSRLSVDATANFVISHSERIEGQKHVFLQVACLFTNRRGQRLIRIHTLQLPVTSSLSNVFRYTEIDTVTSLLLKQAASMALSGIGGFKEKLVKSCVDMLHAYRVNCASMTSSGQLILPESLKLLPLYVGSIRKMAAFRSGSDIRVDDRVAALVRMLGLPIAQTAPLVYPRVYTLWPLSERAGFPTTVGDNVHMPPTIATSSDKLAADRIYLLDNGSALMIYIREEVPNEVLQSVFEADSAASVAAALARPEGELSEEARRMLAVVLQIRRERCRLPWQPLSVVAPGTPEEARLLALICEDRVAGEMNYVDFLCHVHRLVQNQQD